MSNKVFNILIAGIGGQGGLTLSRILAEAAVKTGFSVKTGETLGMAQRYGSVVSFVRIGGNTYSPIFGSGEADVLLGLELTETVRNMRYLRHHGLIIVADEYRPPSMASITGRAPSRSILLAELARYNAVVVPARKIAVEAGNPRALNMVLLGVLNAATNILPHHVVEDTIRSIIRGEAGEKSVRAYYEGHKWFKNHR
ncbi:iindolepyruvate ferredoxin oxidoreductase, beta subunit [Desulfurococcus amylolyticus 1221n]|uniref:Iindolepyruvate ferredoxin oxidoreductase, beta subunit n=1 Tax=Desulfurococcus amylolyticus (strain DSM 18924 / JCM 16383 / VKM B-2413 / 1221n) TaxID=490899 RepID=B8D4M2_DESA1|nr:indolepyruvate oxidoreductase subunit beta [Desulfurococcus amylolyticus]ACL11053.1 iindolepyruvate ferredoxin oxidoreductase, beta subunit [Desulfurococcus amylolyticus 1221n]